MAHALRAMHVAAITNKAAALPGTTSLALKRSSKSISRRNSAPLLSLRTASSSSSSSSSQQQQQQQEERKCEIPAVAAPLTVASSFLAASAGSAQALTAEDVAGAFSKVQVVSSQVTQTAGNAFAVVKDFLQQAFTAVKPAVDVATPYVQQTADAAFKAVAPVANDLEQQAEKALQNAGVDTKPVLDAAKTVVSVAGDAAGEAGKYIEGAQPYALSTVENLLASDPVVLAGGAGALLLVYFLAPPLFSTVAYAARGYKGDLTAPQALDLLTKEDYTLIDVRTDKEKVKSGVPSLPRNIKNKLFALPVEELGGKLRGQLRNARKVEAEVTAIKISSLKRVNKGSKIVIIDSTGDIAKSVARSLSSLGFSNTWVVADGFDGGKGWIQSRLGTESYNLSYAEVLSPTRIIPAGTRRFFSSSSAKEDVVDVGTTRLNRLLPGGFDE